MSANNGTPDSQKDANDRLRERMKSSKYIAKFKLPPQEVLIDDWSCALSKSILFQGRLYMSQGYICFHSNVFGKNIREAIRFEDISTIKKKNKFAIGIEVHLKNNAGKYFFCSFIARSKTYKAICAAWQSRCGISPDAVDMASSSSSSSLLMSSTSPNAALPGETLTSNSEDSSDSDSSSSSGDLSAVKGDGTNMFKVFTPVESNENPFLDGKQNRVEVFKPTEIGLTPAQYFYLIYSDYSHEFEKGIKYLTPRWNVDISKWAPNPEYGGAVTREIKYNMSLVELKAPIGPPETRVSDTYRYVLTNDKCVYQIKSYSLDIPYGDCFHIEAEWTITLNPASPASSPSSFVSATACLAWSKRCLMKAIVEATTLKQIRTQYIDFFKHVTQHVANKAEILSTISFDKPAKSGRDKDGNGGGDKKKKKGSHRSHRSNAVAINGSNGNVNGMMMNVNMPVNVKAESGRWNYLMNGILIVFSIVLMYLSVKVSKIEKVVNGGLITN